MSDLLVQEVTEAVRRDRAEKFWVENRGLLIAVVVAVIVGTAGGQMYRSHKNERNSAFTATLVDATKTINAGDANEAIAPLRALSEKASGEQRSVALLWLARAELKAEKTADAEVTLTQAIQSAEKNSVWQDTACVWLAGTKGTWPEGCDAMAASPLQATKLELAAADRIAAQDWPAARRLIAKLREATENLPEQHRRTAQLELLLPPETAEPVPSAKE